MQRRQELCRNFQRGSCQYGAHCKFLHATQQQQKPNSFGFGVQNSSQPKGSSDFGAKYQNPVKPFQNKWNRFSALNAAGAAASQQSETQPQVVNHACTDPESCKQVIVEDFKHEQQLWKLTCYGHWKGVPCDIVGDTSYEELRAAAYEDASRGMTLQSIVERERNMLNSKLAEFDNLLRNPYVISRTTSSSGPSLFPGTNLTASSTGVQTNGPLSATSFSQLGTSINVFPAAGSLTPPNSAFGQPSPFQVSSQTSPGFDMNRSAVGSPGLFGIGQQAQQPVEIVPSSNFQNLGNSNATTISSNTWNLSNSAMPNNVNVGNPSNNAMNIGTNPFSVTPLTALPNQVPSFSNSNQSSTSFFGGPLSVANPSNNAMNIGTNPFSVRAAGPVSVDAISADTKGIIPGDRGVWLKEWKAGEIPEEEPPPEVC